MHHSISSSCLLPVLVVSIRGWIHSFLQGDQSGLVSQLRIADFSNVGFYSKRVNIQGPCKMSLKMLKIYKYFLKFEVSKKYINVKFVILVSSTEIHRIYDHIDKLVIFVLTHGTKMPYYIQSGIFLCTSCHETSPKMRNKMHETNQAIVMASMPRHLFIRKSRYHVQHISSHTVLYKYSLHV